MAAIRADRRYAVIEWRCLLGRHPAAGRRRAAAGLVAPEDHWVLLFEEPLDVAQSQRWPFDRARVELAYGERLRRSRATTEARLHLTTAFEGFRRLDATPW